MIDLEHIDDVVLLRWRDGENRFNPASVARWHELLDELEAVEGPLALVLTGEGKFFSNGLDLDAFTADPSQAGHVVEEVHRLLGRMFLFPAYTVAAVNGLIFAGGAMLACAFDHRVMREDRGYWCLPEVDLGLPVTPCMFAAVTARLPGAAAADALVTGRRFTAAEALSSGIVEETAPEDMVVSRAVEVAAAMAGKNREVIADHKRQLFGPAASICLHPTPEI